MMDFSSFSTFMNFTDLRVFNWCDEYFPQLSNSWYFAERWSFL